MKQLTDKQYFATVQLGKQAFYQRSGLILGKELCIGDGAVHQLKDFPNRVVKILRRDDRNEIRRAIKILQHLKDEQNPAVVSLYDIGTFSYDSKTHYGRMYCYYYVMDKLTPLSKTRKWGGKNGYVRQMQNVLFDNDNSKLGQKIPGKIKRFLNHVQKIKHFYFDLHTGNLMVSKRGGLKLIDLEGFM